MADCAISGQVGELSSNYSRSIQVFPAVLHPRSRGYITLNSNDPLAAPKIVANYLTEDHDIKVLVEGIRFAIKLSETSALKQYGMQLDKTPVNGCGQHTFGSQVRWRFDLFYNKFLSINLDNNFRNTGSVQFVKIPVLKTIKLAHAKWVLHTIPMLLSIMSSKCTVFGT